MRPESRIRGKVRLIHSPSLAIDEVLILAERVVLEEEEGVPCAKCTIISLRYIVSPCKESYT